MPTLHQTTFNRVCGTLGAFVLVYSLVSYLIKERLYLSEAVVATGFGIAFGPHGAGWLTPASYGPLDVITLNFSRLVLGVQLVLAGVQLPKKYLLCEWRSLAILLVPVMTIMWIVSSSLVRAFIPNIRFIDALAIAACVTPTDPVLSNSIVKGKFAEKHIAPHLRRLISAESGANDGFGYPFLFLALYILKYNNGGMAVGVWFYETVCYEVLLSIAYGAVVGYMGQKMLHFAESRGFVDRESFLVFAIALALFILGTCGSFGTDDLLACFVAGNVFTWDDWFRVETEDDSLQATIDMLLNLSFFVFFGTIIPWEDFNTPDIPVWRYVVLATCILLVRRLPAVLALYKWIPAIHDFREASIAGYFGCIGVGAIFYVQIALEFLRNPEQREVALPNARLIYLFTPVVYFIVLCSIIVHGFTIFFGKLGMELPKITSRAVSRAVGDTAGQAPPDRSMAPMDSGQLMGAMPRTTALPLSLGQIPRALKLTRMDKTYTHSLRATNGSRS